MAGSLLAFFFGRRLVRLSGSINVLDGAVLSLFAVTGAAKALQFGLGPVQAVILGAVTGVGGGTTRDALIQRTPTILCSELYAIPALAGATITVVAIELRHYGAAAAVIAAGTCFLIPLFGLRLGLIAPRPPRSLGNDEHTEWRPHRHHERQGAVSVSADPAPK